MLFHQRERQRELEAAEASGEALWTQELTREARYQLLYAFEDLEQAVKQESGSSDTRERIRHLVVRDVGLPSLAGRLHAEDDVRECYVRSRTSVVFSLIEATIVWVKAILQAMQHQGYDQTGLSNSLTAYSSRVSTILRHHRLSFNLVDSRFVAFDSQELHSEVVVPTLLLLGNATEYKAVESSYREALEEISSGTPDDAITDAARALEEMLKALGCSGNTLGKRLTNARERGLFGDHDSQLREAMMKIGSWVAADRAEMGDTHPGGVATVDDAWLMVHIVGALILRLSRTPGRGGS